MIDKPISTPRCGDGLVYQTIEECDDGNQDNGDGCLTNCQRARCGDGEVLRGIEACDEGLANGNERCTVDCQRSHCGDGVIQVGEECDAGAPASHSSPT